MAPAAAASDEGPQFWTDGWDGYPWARARLLDALAASGAANPVFLGGDVHANFVADLHADPGNPRSPVLAAEFCGTSITSSGPSARRVAAMRQDNPHIRFADGSRRGYVRLDLTLERLEASLRVVDSVQDRDAGIATQAQFRVRAGRPGIATD